MKEIMETVAGLMALSARTAPKAGGKDFLEVRVLKGREINKLAADMEKYGKETGRGNFDRDSANVKESDSVLLVSLNDAKVTGLNCGACGVENCSDLNSGSFVGPEFDGPWCAWRLIDLGIALGSAVKTASTHNADNRIMYRIGVSAKRLGLIAGEVVVGVPISASGKSIYFDR
ncbi:DUF2148 domain-containing protein [Metallumcola ferriviriculae]|uniref:DUF2148 domain-containing protein n=1 Tax=Metallumcola ferriviriculae TaxID=3039180 RepID=A0AAU0UW12_9FIRM|nr:DUF2148 domain-containing protein [Desulfitibacteraceae bacterium MK1]